MAVILDTVAVTDDPDPSAKKIANVKVTRADGDVLRQETVTTDAENPNARQKVANAKPGVADWASVVRQVPHSYDSGLLTLPGTTGVVFGAALDVYRIFFSNLTDEVQHVTLTDGDGLIYLDRRPLPPREERLLDFGGMTFANGVKWHANGAASAVQGQVKGDQ